MIISSKIFHDILTHEAICDKDQIAGLIELVQKYPYCHISHMLLCKAFKDHEDIRQKDQLKQTAIRIPKREVLYDFLHPEIIRVLPTDENSEEPVVNNEPVPIEEAKAELNTDSFQQSILESAISYSIEREIIDELEAPQSETETPPSPPQETEVKTETEVEIEVEAPLSAKNFNSYTEWLLYLKQKKQKITSSSEEKKDKTETSEKPVSLDEIRPKTSSNQQLIDKFIKSDPKIQPKKEFYNPVNMARKSVTDEGDIVSETLAKIYESQGKIKKAIDTYNKLCLKFPEKSSYFVARIKSLENLNKRNNL